MSVPFFWPSMPALASPGNFHPRFFNLPGPGKNLALRMGLLFLLFPSSGNAQAPRDTMRRDSQWSYHFQSTTISQYHPAFHSAYNGQNSLDPASELHTSVSGTLFLGARLWKGAEAYFNPEISGGAGFSQTIGVAGFPNGEVYRVSDPVPHLYLARLYVRQLIPLSGKYEFREEGPNQLAAKVPTDYLAVSAGKFSVTDFFDNNRYSHDPRSQFFNWALMGNGAWDYPANTRGYTYGLVVELVKPQLSVRFSSVMVATTANGNVMDADLLHARSEALEFVHQYSLGRQTGTLRLMGYLTHARMGNYRQALARVPTPLTAPDIGSTGQPGRTKYGFGINLEQPLSSSTGLFARAGWNDGRNETWAFTEIDRHLSVGVVADGSFLGRKNDRIGLAQVVNGISRDHRDYLKAGGYGFIIGDGGLLYGPECITELYYSFGLPRYGFWLTPDYQFILYPAYNRSRGPVHSVGLRLHFEI